ncbi:MAG TPA: c-type cytochrome [Usitatibacter sp.]|nr:c-type cytochrome [Usitatibacter sp.]
MAIVTFHRQLRRGDARRAAARGAFAFLLGACAALAAPACRADAGAGRELATSGAPGGVGACSTCHGAQGEGQPQAGFPRRAGQGRAYLVKQLRDFRAGRRHNPVMEPVAKALDEKQLGDAADYFSSLPGTAARVSFDDTPKSDGERIALRGDWDHGVPGCFKCHGEGGRGIAPHFPAIAGQGATYTSKQLRDWKSGARANDAQGLMKSVADHLPDSEIDVVAGWLASLR